MNSIHLQSWTKPLKDFKGDLGRREGYEKLVLEGTFRKSRYRVARRLSPFLT